MYLRLRTLLILAALVAFFSENLSHATAVLSYHYDSVASGVNSTETALNPSNLTVSTFAKKYSTAVDGQIYAQPLYVPSVVVTGGSQAGTHNLAIVATQHDSVYAIDADSGVIVWQTSFLTTATGLPNATTITSMPSADTGSTDTSPEIGVCGTPVIDGTTSPIKYLYVAAKTKQIISGNTAVPSYVYTMYKLDITNGNTANANIVTSNIVAVTTYDGTNYTFRTATSSTAAQDPYVLGNGNGAINVGGQTRLYFNAMRAMNRPALLLYNGNVFVCFGSHGDNGPYHGWMIGFDKGTLAVTSVFNDTPNGQLGGIWGGGAVPVVDGNGYIYFMTGNGVFDGFNNSGVPGGLDSLGFPVNGDYGDCFLKIGPDTTTVGAQGKNGWGMKVIDYFSPFNNQALDSADTDLGSGGCVLLPATAGSMAHPNLLVGAGKQGNIYMLDTSSLGKFMVATDNVVQSQVAIGDSFSTPAFFNGVLYYVGEPDNGKAFTITGAAMATTPVKTPDTFGWPGATPSISSNGTTNGVVWAIDRNTAQLRAYYAATSSANAAPNFGTEIWTSAMAANSRDALGTPAKFAPPIVADGHVLVGTTTALVDYGLTTASSGPPAAPTTLTATAVSGLQINLSWTDNATNETGFSIEQSTDGTNFSPINTVGANVTSYSVISNLQVGTLYYYRVRAYNTYQTLSYSGYSNVASATTTAQAPTLNFANGFAGSNTLLKYNVNAKIVGTTAQLTDGGVTEGGTVWSQTVQNIQRFSTQFTFQLTNPNGDGITFAIQNNSNTAIGQYGGALAYTGIANSIAVKFDIYNNTGEGANSTGLYTGGANPFTPSTDLTASGINLHSGDVFMVTLNYDGTNLTETITDTVTAATQTIVYPINIPTTIGSNTGYVGFTGSSGGSTAIQSILTWSYAPLPTTVPAAPTNLNATPASGTQVNLSWTDNSTNESGFDILRGASASGPFSQVGVVGAGVTTYPDTALTPNTTYYYEVYATNSVGNSTPSNVASALTPIPPATPTNAQPTAITTTTINMTWTNNATNATAYNIFRKLTAGNNFSQIASLAPTATSYLDTNLTPGTSYDYHIQAYNLAGYSDFSGFTAVTLPSSTLPIITVTASGPVAVNGVTSGQFTFTRGGSTAASLPFTYTVTGTAQSGTDYTALSGALTIPAGATSINLPVASLPGATTNSTVIATVASTATYTAGSPASATVVIEGSTYNATAQTAYATSTVTGTAGGTVTLTFPGLPGSPSGATYVWYLNGTAFTTTGSGSYSLTNAITTQSGTYSVYAWAPGGITGSASYNVTISNPAVTITTSVATLTVKDGSSGSFNVSLSSAPTANVTVNVAISGTPAMTVSPATLTMTPTSYQNQPVTVTAAAINSNDSNRSATVALTGGTANASVAVNDVVSDTQTAANLTGITYPLTGSNIGTGSAGASSVHASGNLWVDGSGSGGLSSAADSFHLESQSVTGNFQMVVNLQNLVATGATAPLAGLMIRDGTAAGSNFLALAGTAATSGGYSLLSRTTVNAASTTTVTSGTNMTYTYPAAWLELTRVGNVLHAFVSSDGVTYYEVTNPSTGVTWTGISSALSIGLFSSSGNTSNARAVLSNFSITIPATSSFADADIGSPGIAGSASVTAGIYSIVGGGADIWGAADQFNFYSQSATGNDTMIVHVDSEQNTDVWTKAGLMYRNSNAVGDAFVSIYQNPGGFVELQWRDTLNAQANWGGSRTTSTATANWLELVKVGSVFTAYYATTTGTPASTDWILVGTHTTTFTNTNYLAGLAVTSHNNALTSTCVFSNYSTQNLTVPPVGLTDVDIGSPGIAGQATGSGTSYTVYGGGADIWGAADQFNYLYQTNSIDKTIIAHVDSVQNTDVWAKAGLMFRNTTAVGDAFVAIYENPGGYLEVQWRDTLNGQAAWGYSRTLSTATANWLRLVKSGNTFSAYYATTTATPGTTDWILLGTHNTTFTGTTFLGGFAVTAHNNALINTSVYSGYSQQ